jgi:hypothetical protein
MLHRYKPLPLLHRDRVPEMDQSYDCMLEIDSYLQHPQRNWDGSDRL